MARETLVNSSGSEVTVNEGESCIVTVTLVDSSGNDLAKSSIDTLAVSLYNAEDSATINSRDNQSVLDANNGTVSTAGVLTLKLGPNDNAIVDTGVLDFETHYLDVQWTWTDADSDTLTGRHEFQFDVIPQIAPQASPDNPSPGWPA